MLRKNEQKVGRAVKAVNRPTLYKKIFKIAIEVDDIRGEEMGNFIIALTEDKQMRELIESVASHSFAMKACVDPSLVTQSEREDFIADMAQLAAEVIVATRLAVRA
jgi:hypothetical protein